MIKTITFHKKERELFFYSKLGSKYSIVLFEGLLKSKLFPVLFISNDIFSMCGVGVLQPFSLSTSVKSASGGVEAPCDGGDGGENGDPESESESVINIELTLLSNDFIILFFLFLFSSLFFSSLF